MYRDGNVVAESMVVQHIDCEEEKYVNEPPSYWYSVRFEEEGRFCLVELGSIASCSYEEELDEC